MWRVESVLAIKLLSLSSRRTLLYSTCDAVNETLKWQIHFVRNIPENRGHFQEGLLFLMASPY